MNCSEAMELISSRLDGALSPAEEDALQAHLAQCASCRSVQAELSQLNSDLAALSCEPPQALHARVMREVRQKSRRKKDQRAVLRFVGAMAAAAALLAVLAGSHLLSLPGFGDDTMVSMIGVSIARPEKKRAPCSRQRKRPQRWQKKPAAGCWSRWAMHQLWRRRRARFRRAWRFIK